MTKCTELTVLSVGGTNLGAVILGLALLTSLELGVVISTFGTFVFLALDLVRLVLCLVVGFVVRLANLFAVLFLFEDDRCLSALDEGLEYAVGIVDFDFTVRSHKAEAFISCLRCRSQCSRDLVYIGLIAA